MHAGINSECRQPEENVHIQMSSRDVQWVCFSLAVPTPFSFSKVCERKRERVEEKAEGGILHAMFLKVINNSLDLLLSHFLTRLPEVAMFFLVYPNPPGPAARTRASDAKEAHKGPYFVSPVPLPCQASGSMSVLRTCPLRV